MNSTFMFTGEKYTDIPFSDYILLDIRQTAIKINNIYSNTLHITPNKSFTSFRVQDLHRDFTIFVNHNSSNSWNNDELIRIRKGIYILIFLFSIFLIKYLMN